MGGDSTGILRPSVKSSINSSLASTVCNKVLVAMWREESGSGQQASSTVDGTA